MNSFNDEVCEYISKPVTENFKWCGDWGFEDNSCPSGCRSNGFIVAGPCIDVGIF